LLAGALKGYVRHLGHQLDLYEADFDQIEMQVLDPASALHEFAPETTIIYLAAERVAADYGTLSIPQRANFANEFMERVRSLHKALSARRYQTIFFNLTDPGDGIFGHFGGKVAWSLRNQIRLCNVALAGMAQDHDDFSVFDLAGLQAAHGRAAMFEPKLYFTSKFALSPGILPLVARDLAQVLIARRGSFVKCVILDLDNTLWGGVVGDDGVDRIQIGDLGLGPAFSALQSWIKQLRDRGIVLAICSKNDEANAREPFTKHPDMVLRLDDIAVFIANWNDKATNIRQIKSVIDVDYGAMMFLDDNPAERQLVRESFPTMLVPELPLDPTEYVSYLLELNPFEAGSYTAEDVQRTSEYQAEVKRRGERENFVDLGDFLLSLQMKASVRGFLPFNIPRVAQLTQRSNQFNLRTVRYSEKQIADLATSETHVALAFELQDRFGDSGLISVVIMEERGDDLFIDTWLMSCRVLGRGMEQFVLNTLMSKAKARGVKRVVGEYLATSKNGMVKDHYKRLGFNDSGTGFWVMDVENYREMPVHIEPDAEPAPTREIVHCG
jgi:FkbH-like protein